MTSHEFNHLVASLDGLTSGKATELRRELDNKIAASEEASGQGGLNIQCRLLAEGLLSEIKPPVTDFTPYRNRKAIPIDGEPLSETVIRERR